MKYKVGQKVKIRSLEWYRDNVNRYGIIECGKYEFFEPMNEYCGKVVTIKRIDDDNYRIDADKGAFCWTDEMIEGLVEEEEIEFTEEDKYWCDIMSESDPTTYVLPQGYQFVDENGNVINATKIVLEKKKKEYPKTFEECVHVLEGDSRMSLEQMNTFRRLIDARNAYWKIAGDEMGLGKPWKPDYDSGADKFGIICLDGVVQESNPTTNWERHLNKILDFPTRAMRDAFKENFDPDIEICKELL